MDPRHRNDLVLLLQQHQNQLVQVHQFLIERRRRKRRRRRVVRNIWVRDWIGRRPELELYDLQPDSAAFIPGALPPRYH